MMRLDVKMPFLRSVVHYVSIQFLEDYYSAEAALFQQLSSRLWQQNDLVLIEKGKEKAHQMKQILFREVRWQKNKLLALNSLRKKIDGLLKDYNHYQNAFIQYLFTTPPANLQPGFRKMAWLTLKTLKDDLIFKKDVIQPLLSELAFFKTQKKISPIHFHAFNRVFFLALTVEPKQWTEEFRKTLLVLICYCSNPSIKICLPSYLPTLLDNLTFFALLSANPSLPASFFYTKDTAEWVVYDDSLVRKIFDYLGQKGRMVLGLPAFRCLGIYIWDLMHSDEMFTSLELSHNPLLNLLKLISHQIALINMSRENLHLFLDIFSESHPFFDPIIKAEITKRVRYQELTYFLKLPPAQFKHGELCFNSLQWGQVFFNLDHLSRFFSELSLEQLPRVKRLVIIQALERYFRNLNARQLHDLFSLDLQQLDTKERFLILNALKDETGKIRNFSSTIYSSLAQLQESQFSSLMRQYFVLSPAQSSHTLFRALPQREHDHQMRSYVVINSVRR